MATAAAAGRRRASHEFEFTPPMMATGRPMAGRRARYAAFDFGCTSAA
jgi:hypothetical protein